MTLLRLKRVATIAVSNVDKKSVEGERAVRLCNYTDVYYNESITSDLPFMEATATAEQVSRFGLRAGDVLVTKDSETADDIAVPSYVVENMSDVVCGYHLAVMRSRPGTDGRYLFWALASRDSREQFAASATGVTRFGLRYEVLGDVLLPSPPPQEQRAIAKYLDAETARIDALIASKLRLMELAMVRLRSLISSVTENGPEVRVRHLTSMRTSGPRGWADRVADFGDAPFIRSANLRRDNIDIREDNLVRVDPPTTEEARRSAVRSGDVLVGITGANTGWVGCATDTVAGGFVSQHVAILRPSGVESAWLAYSLVAAKAQDQLLGGQYGGTKQQLGLDDLAELKVHCPRRGEQQRRVALMAQAHSSSQRLIGCLQRQIDLLAERRQVLITTTVTGESQLPEAPS
ncbi:MAG: hypothetical protein JWN52_4298 [Actinomycetia bacterium]|nr:hypothetical protein [Actinomycetes bacterium]